MRIEPEEIKNILAVRNDRFGEFLLNIPALRALKETFGNARLELVVDPYVKELAECVPFIDGVIEWGRGSHSLLEKLQLISLLRRQNIDIAVMLNPSREFNIITALAGIPLRAGYDRKWGFLLTHKIKDSKYRAEKHEIEYNLELAGLCRAKTADKSLVLNISGQLPLCGIEDTDRFIAIHPWTSDPLKQWPQENFRELAKKLTQELSVRIVIVGAHPLSGQDSSLFDNLGGNIINMLGRTTLKELALFLKKSALLVSGDSGPVHLACAVDTPVLAIFASGLPGKSSRRWGPLQKNSAVIERDNLSEISAEEVFTKVMEVLNKR